MKRVAVALSIAAAVGLAAAIAELARDTGDAPRIAQVRAAYCPSDLRLLDRHGVPIHALRVDRTRRRLAWTPLAAVSPPLVAALIASEDRAFAEHGGVDWRAVGAALWQRLRGGPPRGASTITMQLAALLDPQLARRGAPRSWRDKWRQMRAAWGLERAWSKEEILEAYLNLVTFRGEIQGVGAAAEVLFGKAPHGLTRAESVVLAALVRSPNAARDALATRAARLAKVLDVPDDRSAGLPARTRVAPVATAAEGRATVESSKDGGVENAALRAAIDRVVDAPAHGAAQVALAPHAAHRLLHGGTAAACTDTRSTLDADVQRVAVDTLRRHLIALQGRAVRDAAVLVADNASGDVLAYVGASGDLSSARHVDGVQAARQAGSTLKPFLYGLALDRRLLTAASLLDDGPLEIAVGGGVFRPRNYDGHFRGPVSVREALAGSINVPAVRALELVGADSFAAHLRRLGFDGVDRPGDYYGPSLALGSADVSLWQLVNAYRALANGGVWTPLRLTGSEKRTAESAQADDDPAAFSFPLSASAARRVFSPAAAFIVSDILADRDSRAATFGLESPLATRFWTAVKTGTSKDMRDNWCVGYSRRYTVGVWVGNFSGAPMHDVSGISGAAPIWEEVMSWLHREQPSTPPHAPATLVRGAADEWFLAGTEPDGGPSGRAAAARIASPTDGAVIAIDPDIPAARQRVGFAADPPSAALAWRLDGNAAGAAARLVLWAPAPGRHVLELIDDGGRTLQRASFEVRGGASTDS